MLRCFTLCLLDANPDAYASPIQAHLQFVNATALNAGSCDDTSTQLIMTPHEFTSLSLIWVEKQKLVGGVSI